MNELPIGLDGSKLLWVACFVFGTLVGSFLNVVIARLPEGESIAFPGSRCPVCLTPILPWHNIPIISWVLLRGRCAYCQAPISLRYPVVEILTGFLFAACAARFGFAPVLPAALLFSGAMIAVAFIDLDTWLIPDEIVVFGLPIAIVLRPLVFDVPWWSGFAGAVLGASFLLAVRWIFFVLRGVEAMGLGDVKLIAVIGGFLGSWALIPTITIGSLLGSLAGLVMLTVNAKRSSAPKDNAEQAAAAEEDLWARKPSKLRLGAIARVRGRRVSWGLPANMAGRTFVRAGFLFGYRGPQPKSGLELTFGLFQDVPGWGHFEGVGLGRPLRIWAGPLLGARLPDVEAYGDEDEWEPPPTALPFGPFLVLGALATMLFSAFMRRWAGLLGF